MKVLESFSLKYIGPQSHVLIELSSKKKVVFSLDNDYVYVPSNFDEVYEILSILQNLVKFTLDPNSNITMRRIVNDAADAVIFNEETVLLKEYNTLKQKEWELSNLLSKQFEDKINFQIASGILKSKPKDYHNQLKEYITNGLEKELPIYKYLTDIETFKQYKLNNKQETMNEEQNIKQQDFPPETVLPEDMERNAESLKSEEIFVDQEASYNMIYDIPPNEIDDSQDIAAQKKILNIDDGMDLEDKS